jgi:integrase
MGRPPLAVGAYGNISYRTLGPRKVRALCKVRDADGRIRDVTREGTSKADARTNLLAAIEQRPGFSGATITGDSTVEAAAQAWLAEVERHAGEGQRAPNTPRLYRSALTNHVIPGVGALRLQEATVPRLDAFLVGMRQHHGAAITKTTRTVLNGILGYAARQGAIRANPMREVSRIAGAPKRSPRALTGAERDEWLAKMEADVIAAHRDLPDLTRFMLATGCRIGEALAVTFDEVDVDDKIVRIDWTIDRVKGAGLQRKSTKTAAGERTLRLPGWAVDMVIRRGDRYGWTGPLFPVPDRRKGKQTGGVWRDPSNTSRDLREARDRAGFGWVTSHAFRKTVATVMDEAGMSAREIADQLGHARPSITQDVYMGRRAVGTAAALEDMFGESAGDSSAEPVE